MSATAEERREEREAIRRSTRVQQVYAEIAKATASKRKRISTADISAATGYSERLVLSTINLVNRTTSDYGASASKMLTYAPPKRQKGEPGGWSVASSWADRAAWHATLHRHATTRVESLEEFADVMEGLWPNEADRPGALAAFYAMARSALDQATTVMAPRSVPNTPVKSARRGKVKLIP